MIDPGMKISIPAAELLKGPPDNEREELLMVLAEQKAYLQDRPFLRKLIETRPAEIDGEYARRGLPLEARPK